MDDNVIIALYLDRDERAIQETRDKYDLFCRNIAFNILHDYEDADECVADTYLRTWNTIPPVIPTVLSAFLAKITRRLSIDRLRFNRAKKRYTASEVSFDELRDCVSAPDDLGEQIEAEELAGHINVFLSRLRADERDLFICRYFYCDSILELRQQFSCSESKVKTTLFRTRKKLKDYLEREGLLHDD